MLEKFKTITETQRRLSLFVAGALLGVLGFGLYRFLSVDFEHTHYHANFAVYINGEKEQFEGFAYYEELTGCSLDTGPYPRGRAHMHEPENGLVHLHDEAVTWGNFFENLGFSVGRNHVSTPTDTYVKSDNLDITYVLNGEVVSVSNIASKEIVDTDRLLVAVGADKSESLEFFESVVPANAAEFNESSDPGTCSSGENHGFTDRLREVF
jgi:hypothetical protein